MERAFCVVGATWGALPHDCRKAKTMAARLNRRHSEQIRAKIQAAVIVTRLHQHIMGEVEMTPSQVAAANSLLDRSVPKLSQIQHVGDEDGGPIQHAMTIEFVDAGSVPGEA